MKRILFLFLLTVLISSCKNNKSTQEKVIKSRVEEKPLIKIKKVIKSKNSCLKITDNFLTLPIDGGDNLMTSLIENDIETVEYNCNFDENLIKKLCSTDSRSLYLLPKSKNVTLTILSDECGDNNHYLLLTFKDNKLVDHISIYQYYEEMDENSKKSITNFKITKNLELTIYKKEFNGKILESETSKKYRIDASGEIAGI